MSQPNERHVRLRQAIAIAVEDATAEGALSDEWAGSILANLWEPPADDEEGWAILGSE